MNFEDRDYIENLMFNSAVELKGLSEENLGNISRSIFTEIDHNYVNPTSNLFRQQILKAIPDYKIWNNSSSYASSIKTFNEYMTWATFTLFAREYFDLAVFNRVNANTELIMVKSRGFLKFNDFNQELLRLFNDRAKDQTVSNLYPKIISWMEKQGH